MGVLAPKGQSRCLCRSESKAQFPDLFLSCTRSLGSECRSCSGRALLRLRLGLRLTDGGFIESLAALVYSVSPDVTYGAGALVTIAEAQVPRVAPELWLECVPAFSCNASGAEGLLDPNCFR